MYDNSKGRVSVFRLRASEPLVNFLKRFEELRLKAYQDQGGVWTIGWGHTGSVGMGDQITEATAESLFKSDLAEPARVLRLDGDLKFYQHEYDALISFIFNIGAVQWSRSTMRRALKMGRYDLAADEFMRWVHVKGKVSNGLKRRRHDEMKMFQDGTYR